MAMNLLYGLSDSDPGGGVMPSPILRRLAAFSSARETSQPPSKIAKAFALSGMFIFSAPIASATSVVPAFRLCTARLNAELPEAQAFSTL